MNDAYIILLASGSGSRFGARGAKQLLRIGRESVLGRSLRTALALVPGRRIVLTCPAGERGRYRRVAARYDKSITVVEGGVRRQDSVRNAVAAVAAKAGVVLIHDSARPLAGEALFRRVYAAAKRHGAVIPVIASPDTVKETADGAVKRTIDRSTLGLAQTPQGFRIALLAGALAASDNTAEYTDEAGLLERSGVPVHVVEGERRNLKLTFPDDLAIIKALAAADERTNRAGD